MLRVSVITPCLNSSRFIEEQLRSVAMQRSADIDVEHIVLDAGSKDGTREILERNYRTVTKLICERDKGPADAINKGFRLATGEFVCWLNADDLYAPKALARACAALALKRDASMAFGRCPIIDAGGKEIRKPITLFKEMWHPISSRPTLQMINYISQPASVYRRSAVEAAGPLRTDLKAAWDYEFLLRLLRQGPAVRVPSPPMAYFRWTPDSISGRHFSRQFKEEYDAAAADAGKFSPQAIGHFFVRHGIVASYAAMRAIREFAGKFRSDHEPGSKGGAK